TRAGGRSSCSPSATCASHIRWSTPARRRSAQAERRLQRLRLAPEARATRKARRTMNHPKPETRAELAHITAQAGVGQGRRKKPRKGTNQESNARLSRSVKRNSANSASRGEITAKRTSRQGTRGPYRSAGGGGGESPDQFTDSLAAGRKVSRDERKKR